MKSARQELGKWGEALAADYLAGQGYAILARNARTSYGEIDLVARQATGEGLVVVFVEVKTRSSGAFGYPEEAVNARKQSHLLAAAQDYLQAHPELEPDWRVDVISIERTDPSRPAVITHFENAFS